MEKTKLKFTREKETKNTVRFQEAPEEGSPPKVGTLYLQKWFAGDIIDLTVTIQEGGYYGKTK